MADELDQQLPLFRDMAGLRPRTQAVQVIGSVANDRALSVRIEGQNEPLWLDPDLLEYVDHAPATTARIGIKVSRVARTENGLRTLASTTMFNADAEIGIAIG